MSGSYFKSKVPEPFRVLGLTLGPMSLGHYGLLKRFDCAFVAEEEASASGADLLIGVLICSMRPEEFLEFANSPGFARAVRGWSRKVSPRPWMARVPGLGRWWRKRHGFDLFEKVSLFKAYIEQASEVPKFWDESDDSRVSGSHWAQSVEIILRSELGWSREEVNGEPLSKALADYFKFAETKGMVRLMTEYEIELIEAAEKAAARVETANPKDQIPSPIRTGQQSQAPITNQGGGHGA
jgi:hypothetical protein